MNAAALTLNYIRSLFPPHSFRFSSFALISRLFRLEAIYCRSLIHSFTHLSTGFIGCVVLTLADENNEQVSLRHSSERLMPLILDKPSDGLWTALA